MPGSIAQAIREAEEAESRGENHEALRLWRMAAEAEPRPRILARLGRRLIRNGLADEGVATLHRAIATDPDAEETHMAHFVLGVHFKNASDLPLAQQHLEESTRLLRWAPALTVLGEVYRRLGMTTEARHTFEQATELAPTSAEAWYGAGLTVRDVDPTSAMELFRRALEVDPNEAAAHRELGYLLWLSGQYDEAERQLRAALALDEQNPWGHEYLGSLLLSLDRAGEAEREFRMAIALWPEVPLFYCDLGDSLARQNRLTEADVAYKHSLAANVNDYVANLRYGQLLMHTGRLRDAQRYLTRALATKPGDERASKSLEALALALEQGQRH
jgi:Flp pilus assembly protein TadD